MNKEDIIILQDRLKEVPNDSICIIFRHSIDSCNKYSANLVKTDTPVYENLAEKLTKARTMRKRCVFCRKNISKYSDLTFQIKSDVIEYLHSKKTYNLY